LSKGAALRTQMQHNEVIMAQLQKNHEDDLAKDIKERELAVDRRAIVTKGMIACVKAVHTEYEQRANQLMEARAKLTVLMGEVKKATANAKAAQAHRFSDEFVTLRVELVTKFAMAANLMRVYVDAAGRRVEHLKRKVDRMDTAVGQVSVISPNCGLEKRTVNDATTQTEIELVKTQDVAEAASTEAFEVKKHIPCLAKKYGVSEDPATVPDLYPTYCKMEAGDMDAARKANEAGKEEPRAIGAPLTGGERGSSGAGGASGASGAGGRVVGRADEGATEGVDDGSSGSSVYVAGTGESTGESVKSDFPVDAADPAREISGHVSGDAGGSDFLVKVQSMAEDIVEGAKESASSGN